MKNGPGRQKMPPYGRVLVAVGFLLGVQAGLIIAEALERAYGQPGFERKPLS